MKWICINDELPPKDGQYLVTNNPIKNLKEKDSNDLQPICPCCRMECKYCEAKQSRREFIHRMVTGKNTIKHMKEHGG
jgi:hypothetical protein